jgi:glycerate kinase
VRVLVAPDSFKGTIEARDAAEALATGWSLSRPHDDVVLLPLADGGEGTGTVLAYADPGSTRVVVRIGPPGHRDVGWNLLADGTAVVEVAEADGLPTARLRALSASTDATGELVRSALGHPGVQRIFVALGGSASTDGGSGFLRAIGARFLDSAGEELPPGGGALVRLVKVDLSSVISPPPGGVTCLTDVDAPLLGPRGAAAQFGPQKGAGPRDVARLEEGLSRLAEQLGGDPSAAGAGAAGGTAYGLVTGWGADVRPGFDVVARQVELEREIGRSDVVITGEGAFDEQSLRGKVVGGVLGRVASTTARAVVIAGQVRVEPPSSVHRWVDLSGLAGSSRGAMAEPGRWLTDAAGRVAREW